MLKAFINNLSKSKQFTSLIIMFSFVLLLSITIPSLARFKNRIVTTSLEAWNGTIATSYRSGTGTSSNPYIISNGKELAYLSQQLSSTDYANTYFTLSNDIIINSGIFKYVDNKVQYILNNNTYYVDMTTNKYYDNSSYTGVAIGTLNNFNPLNNFKGYFNGGSYRIYGLYINSSADNLALFTNLEGSIFDLYVENAMIYGGLVTGGISSNATNASLKNILFDGYAIGRNIDLNRTISITKATSQITMSNEEKTDYLSLENTNTFNGSEIASTSITGTYTIDNAEESNTTIKINGITVTGGSFNISLGVEPLDSIPVVTISNEASTLTFSNITYNITYNYGITGGIIASNNNSEVENAVNKAYLYGYSVSGSIVGVTNTSLTINNSYNKGIVHSDHIAGGIIGVVEKSQNSVLVSKCFNDGEVTAISAGSLISIIDNSLVSINDSFSVTNNYSVDKIISSTVTVSNSYTVTGVTPIREGNITGSFISTEEENLKTKSFIINNLSFNEFISLEDMITNPNNIWIYEDNKLPILFLDDISNPIASIHVNIYSWNNLSYTLSTIKLSTNITFSLESVDELKPVKEMYYYISNSNTPLTNTEISNIIWVPYTDIQSITAEGFYIIYAKIVDYSDNVTYLNTDLIVLDLSGSQINATLLSNSWSSLKSSLDYTYINKGESLSVTVTDSLSGIKGVYYYITDQILDNEALNSLSDSIWTIYAENIQLTSVGKYVIYIKAVDNCNYVTYINTDYIIFDGYTESDIRVGKNISSYPNSLPYITDKSTLTLNFTYSKETSEMVSPIHNLVSSFLLPIGTNITLIDNITSEIYKYKITTSDDIYNYNNSCEENNPACTKEAIYPFSLFKEIGTGTVSKDFIESSHYSNGTISENFSIILDLSDTNITSNYEAEYMYINVINSGITMSTLESTIKNFSIYSSINNGETDAELSLSTTYEGEINLNIESSTNIDIESALNYKYVNGYKVIDTTYEDKKVGLLIKLVDSNGNTITKDNLKHIIFKIGDTIYYPSSDNAIHISLDNGIIDTTKTITLVTYNNNTLLDYGTYYLNIASYASYDGYSYSDLSNTLSFPVAVADNFYNINYNFNVIASSEASIIYKKDSTTKISFDILVSGELESPNVKVSLYKKDSLTAYNQSYSLVDLKNFVSDTLNNYIGSTYYVTTNPIIYNGLSSTYNHFELNLVNNNFLNTGYKYVFELYDGNRKIGTIEKYFIVK